VSNRLVEASNNAPAKGWSATIGESGYGPEGWHVTVAESVFAFALMPVLLAVALAAMVFLQMQHTYPKSGVERTFAEFIFALRLGMVPLLAIAGLSRLFGIDKRFDRRFGRTMRIEVDSSCLRIVARDSTKQLPLDDIDCALSIKQEKRDPVLAFKMRDGSHWVSDLQLGAKSGTVCAQINDALANRGTNPQQGYRGEQFRIAEDQVRIATSSEHAEAEASEEAAPTPMPARKVR
jgi:hypothetical protein